jgi:hypothetical protein
VQNLVFNAVSDVCLQVEHYVRKKHKIYWERGWLTFLSHAKLFYNDYILHVTAFGKQSRKENGEFNARKLCGDFNARSAKNFFQQFAKKHLTAPFAVIAKFTFCTKVSLCVFASWFPRMKSKWTVHFWRWMKYENKTGWKMRNLEFRIFFGIIGRNAFQMQKNSWPL